MGTLTSWMYPLQGILYLISAPQLLRVVLRFLMIVTLASIASTIAWFYFFWGWHLHLIAKLFGLNIFSKAVTWLVLLTESALPVYVIFHHRFEKLQQQLFDATIEMRGTQISQLQQQDREALAQQLAARQRQRQRQQASPGQQQQGLTSKLLIGGVTTVGGWLIRLVLKPKPKEGLLMRKSRDIATLAVSVFLPMLLPLFAWRDSQAESASLLSRYWDLKGCESPEAQEIILEQRAGDYRSFGIVAAGLNYVPVLNWFLGLTNMVGAALYAADMEKKQAPLFRKSWLSR